MAITVKKKLTVKTVKARAPGELGAEQPAEGAEPTAEGAPAADTAVPEAAAAAPVAAVAAGPRGKPASYTFAGICAIFAVIFFIALLILQAMEWDFYQGAFPVPGAGASYTPPAAPVQAIPAPAVDTAKPAVDAPKAAEPKAAEEKAPEAKPAP